MSRAPRAGRRRAGPFRDWPGGRRDREGLYPAYARAYGVAPFRFKCATLTASAAVAGLVGAVYTWQATYITPMDIFKTQYLALTVYGLMLILVGLLIPGGLMRLRLGRLLRARATEEPT